MSSAPLSFSISNEANKDMAAKSSPETYTQALIATHEHEEKTFLVDLSQCAHEEAEPFFCRKSSKIPCHFRAIMVIAYRSSTNSCALSRYRALSAGSESR